MAVKLQLLIGGDEPPLRSHEAARSGARHMLARHRVTAAQDVFQAQLICADIGLTVDEKPLLNVVVVSPFEPRQLTVDPPKLVRALGKPCVFGPNTLNPPLSLHLPCQYFIGRKGHDVRKPRSFLCVQQAQHFPSPRRNHLRQLALGPGLGNHVHLPAAILVPEEGQGRCLRIDAVGHLEHQDVAVRFPKPVKHLRFEMDHIHHRLVLGQHRIRLCHDGLQGVAGHASPNARFRHDDELPSRPHFSWQCHARTIAFTRRGAQQHQPRQKRGQKAVKGCWGWHG